MLTFYFVFPDHCRRLSFGSPFHNKALVNHVIKNITLGLGMRSSCRGRCTLNDKCVSYNIGPPIKDQVLCQLSDSDHIQHPEDLVTREEFVYQNSEVRYFDCIRFYVNLWLSLCYFLFIYPFMKICNLFVCFRLTPLNFKLKLKFTIPSVLLRVWKNYALCLLFIDRTLA